MSDLWIVTVVRNDRAGLRATMESIQRQQQRPRLLIVDGASTDGTTEDARTWASALDGEVISQPDRGPYDAMNTAIRHIPADARVWFVNAGDLLVRSDATQIARHYADRGDFVWGFGPHLVLNEDGSERGVVTGLPHTQTNHAYGRTPICHQAVISSIGAIQDLGGFDLRFPIAADYHLLLRMGQVHPPTQWPEVLVAYRAGGISDRQIRRTIRDQARARREALNLRGLAVVRDSSRDARRYLRRGIGVTIDLAARLGLVRTNWRNGRA